MMYATLNNKIVMYCFCLITLIHSLPYPNISIAIPLRTKSFV